MFTGIIEALAKVEKIEREKSNVHFTFSCPFTNELKVDQSVAHNGCCLTVVSLDGDNYTLTAIDETLKNKTTTKFTNHGFFLGVGFQVFLRKKK